MAKKIDINDEDYMMLQPTGERILVKRDAGEERTESGIYYAREQNRTTGVVVSDVMDGTIPEPKVETELQ